MAKRVISAILTLKDKDFGVGLKRAGKEMTDFDRKIQRTKNNINDFSQKSATAFKNIGVAAAGIGATAFTAFGTALVTTINEMDTAFSNLEAKTGATGAKLADLEGVAKDVFTAGFGENIAMVTDDVAMLSSMFEDLNSKQLTQVAKGASTISQLWGAETKEVGRAVQGLTNNFEGLSETKALDLMTFAFQKTGDYSDDLLDTFNEYSVHFSKMGLSAEEFTGILVAGAQAGAFNMDKVGDAVKEFGIRAIDGSESTAEGFKAIGLNADEMANKFTQGGESANNAFMATIAGLASMKDPVKQNAAGVQLFGTMWEDLREDVVLSMADGAKAVQGFEGATSRAAEAMQDNFGTKMKTVWRELKVGIAEAFNNAGGAKLLDDFANKAQEFIPVIENMATGAVNFGTAVRDNWPLIREVMVGVGTFVATLGAIKGAMALVTAAQWLWNAAMAANPITWVVLGIAALVAAGIALYRNFDTVKEKASDLWQTIYDNPILAFVGGPIGALIGAGITIYKNWDTIKEKFNAFKTAITNFKLPKWVTSIGNTISSATSKVKGWFDGPDGSHANGLNYVPYDGYIAELHKGEMVIPARQSERLRQQGANINNVDRVAPTNNITTNNNNSKSSNSVTINVYPNGLTTSQVIDELVPQLELVIANM